MEYWLFCWHSAKIWIFCVDFKMWNAISCLYRVCKSHKTRALLHIVWKCFTQCRSSFMVELQQILGNVHMFHVPCWLCLRTAPSCSLHVPPLSHLVSYRKSWVVLWKVYRAVPSLIHPQWSRLHTVRSEELRTDTTNSCTGGSGLQLCGVWKSVLIV